MGDEGERERQRGRLRRVESKSQSGIIEGGLRGPESESRPAAFVLPTILLGDLNARHCSQTVGGLGLWAACPSVSGHVPHRASTPEAWHTWDDGGNPLTKGSAREPDGKLDWILFHPGGDASHSSAWALGDAGVEGGAGASGNFAPSIVRA